MAQSLQFFRRIMLLLNVTVGAFLVWVFGMTPVLAARQSDGVTFAQNLSALCCAGAGRISSDGSSLCLHYA